jgi:hypothetical protein
LALRLSFKTSSVLQILKALDYNPQKKKEVAKAGYGKQPK